MDNKFGEKKVVLRNINTFLPHSETQMTTQASVHGMLGLFSKQ